MLPTLTLRRVSQSENGTFGEIEDSEGLFYCYTCERPDNGNKRMGCIPARIYSVTPFNSPRCGKDFLVNDVPMRTMIEIHAGNTIKDTDGCILVGDTMGSIAGVKAVLNSRMTLSHMLEDFPNGFELEIFDVAGRNAV